jgi:catechol 2,3-dioxygenase-like lactoylglutathione lyase family enzyme
MMSDDMTGVTGIVAVSLPVSDLARSAAFYRDLLGLSYAREFTDGTMITGCALADFDAGYMISLRLRETTAGHADLRGEHPIIVAVPDVRTLGAIQRRLEAGGFAPTAGSHADAAWVEVLDPDGIALRLAALTAKPHFFGVTPDGFYDTPRLTLPETWR